MWFGLKRDVPRLLTQEFWFTYEVWERFHYGFGMPRPGPWTEQNQQLVMAVLQFEKVYQQYFSSSHAIIEMLEVVARMLSGRRRR